MKMHSVILILKIAGSAVSETSLAALFNIGLRKNETVWQGLPFLVLSTLFAIVTLA